MSTESILIITAAILAFGCVGLLVVRAINRRLLGLGWLSAAFAAGGLGAVLLLGFGVLPRILTVLAADLLVLAAFVFLHTAVLELLELPVLSFAGVALLGVQAIVDIVYLSGEITGRYRIMAAGALIAVQASSTAVMLLKRRRKGIRAPIYFSATLLFALALYNVVRSAALGFHQRMDPETSYRMQAMTYFLFLAFGLGIAFGFFWLTTSRLTARLDELANTDPLTRLYNRRVFLRWCERELNRSKERESSFSVLLLDVDHFKTVNDRFGHAVGDAVLCAVVEKMQDSVRGIDVLGRWGGEEFVALLPGASEGAAVMVAERMRRNIEDAAVPADAEGATKVRVTVSVGVATYKGSGEDIEQILKRADAALYAAKESGRNRVQTDMLTPEELRLVHSS